MNSRIFLLSPADTRGRRAGTLFRPAGDFELAQRLRTPAGAPLGEVFSFVSGLYFRGKLAYAQRFARAPSGLPGTLVITAGRGLLHAEEPVTLAELEEFSQVAIDLRDSRYFVPLVSAAEGLARELSAETEVVLLGSIATSKYTGVLLDIFGERLSFPETFLGLGDMQRGSILLRAASSGIELPYLRAHEIVGSGPGARGRRLR